MILAMSSCNTTPKKTDLTLMNLKGQVESVYEVSYTAVDKFGTIERGNREREMTILGYPKKDIYIKFNIEGMKTEESYFRNTGYGYTKSELSSKIIYRYDLKGNLIEKLEYNSKGNLTEKTISTYSESGDLINEIRYNADGRINSKYNYKYTHNKILKSNFYDGNGNLEKKREYKYYESDKVVELNSYYEDGALELKRVSTYDENDKLIEEINYSKEGEISGIYTYKYFDNGKLAEENWISSSGNIYNGFIYSYDDKGNLSESQNYVHSKDHPLGITKYENGNIIEDSEIVNGDIRRKITYSYEFDKIGNWIKQIKYENTIPKYVIEREVYYFN
ncbi:Antitoxin component YwqK of the YwqJK toxin-antitoxin module [Draconibacterium orientale]|nr:Antitoxin component YwqK of the YwqJK toxin-antitoxin module [Draconibacterium orientale]